MVMSTIGDVTGTEVIFTRDPRVLSFKCISQSVRQGTRSRIENTITVCLVERVSSKTKRTSGCLLVEVRCPDLVL